MANDLITGEAASARTPPDAAEVLREFDIEPVLEQLDRDLVALAPVKQRIREIAALLIVDQLRRRSGLRSARPTLHMSFTGNPGTGKTTVALRMADILHRLGYLELNQLVAVTRDDLVGQYVGHTAPKTKAVLKKAYGGVLFIDEAYYLYRPENERDYGPEAIEILLQVMEDERERLVVIMAGYADRMGEFFRLNPGMGSRVAHHIDFPDYSLDELMGIADLMLEADQYDFAPAAQDALCEYLEVAMHEPGFAHGRSVRNAIERARLRHANRIYELARGGGQPTREDLIKIKPQDVLKSDASPGDPQAHPAQHRADGAPNSRSQ
ncbi:MAG: AAA family ATPase [Solirubrobacteraceae bacterium]